MLIGQAESAQLFLENKGPEQLSKVIKRTSFKKRLKFSSVWGRRRWSIRDKLMYRSTRPLSLSLYIFSTKDWYLPWVLQLAVEFAKECERLIDQYVQRVTDHVLFKVGKCWPLSQAYNTTSAVICQQIFWPFVSRSLGIRAAPVRLSIELKNTPLSPSPFSFLIPSFQIYIYIFISFFILLSIHLTYWFGFKSQ